MTGITFALPECKLKVMSLRMCEEREKTNKMQQLDAYYQLLSQHFETEVDNKHLIVASCWFFSLCSHLAHRGL